MQNLFFFERETWEGEYLRNKLASTVGLHNVHWTQKCLTKDTAKLAKNAKVLGVFVNSPVTKEILTVLPNLKCIVTLSTGFDHIDLGECKKRGVVVLNVPSYGENTVAEHAFALLLNISRKITQSVEETRQGKWCNDGLRGFDLANKTLGILGTGRIGRHMAEYALAFGMKVIAFDKFPNKDWAKDKGIEYLSFAKVLHKSDVISLHLPYSDKTHHVINLKNYKTIQKGSVLINTARGGLIETAALIKGIKDKTFEGLGLDVCEDELAFKSSLAARKQSHLLKQNLQLLRLPNVFITPHNAFNSIEALIRILDTSVENVKGFLRGTPTNVVK